MYSRTQNENGSFNSRCLDCFLTIASCIEAEQELKRLESHHICLEKVLAEVQHWELEHAAHSAHPLRHH